MAAAARRAPWGEAGVLPGTLGPSPYSTDRAAAVPRGRGHAALPEAGQRSPLHTGSVPKPSNKWGGVCGGVSSFWLCLSL
jgi:hypothetical protein